MPGRNTGCPLCAIAQCFRDGYFELQSNRQLERALNEARRMN